MDKYKGLSQHFAQEDIKEEKISKQLKNASKNATKNKQIEANYNLDTLNPINRYKHTHKAPPRKRPKPLSEKEVDKVVIKRGKRIIMLKDKS